MTFLGSRPAVAWLAMCFGVCLPTPYRAVPDKELEEPKPASPRPKRPTTNWREMSLVSKYDLVKQVGKGGFSEIWLAERRQGGDGGGEPRERVALKVVGLTDPDLEEEELATLLAEAKFLRNLDCPYLVKCYETEANQDWLVMTLEYITGGEMLDHIHKVKKYTEAEAAKLFAQVVSAISYLHNLNLIHRDIKPENVMFTAPVEQFQAEGQPLRVKIIDLGMSALYDPQKPIRGCIGTPGFVSPELWHDGPHTPACDIYALGVVLFIMLTGRKPHSGQDIRCMTYCNKSIKDAPGLKDERFLALSSAARELLLAMLADDPRVRPSCLEVLRHPFITAVDSNAEAHREMEESVRRRMRELAQLRRVHGLRYALRVQKPQEADHLAFLRVLDQRRLKFKGDGNHHFGRVSEFGRTSDAGAFGRSSYADYGPPSPQGTTPGSGAGAAGGGAAAGGGGGSVPSFARSSLATSFSQPPLMNMMTPPPPAWPPPSALGTATGTGTFSAASSGLSAAAVCMSSSASPARNAFSASASPFARVSHGSSRCGSLAGGLRGGGGSAGSLNAASGSQVPLRPLQTIVSGALPEQLSSQPLPVAAAAATASAASAKPSGSASTVRPAVSDGGTGGLNQTSESGCDTPDARSRDMGLAVPDSLAARPVPALGGGAGGSGGATGDGAAAIIAPPVGHSRRLLPLDPMTIVNALPALQHCPSADEVMSANLGLAGSSPVATAAMVDEAMMSRCMSANPEVLELLGHQNSIRRTLDHLSAPGPHLLLTALGGGLATVPEVQPQPSSAQQPLEQGLRQGQGTGQGRAERHTTVTALAPS